MAGRQVNNSYSNVCVWVNLEVRGQIEEVGCSKLVHYLSSPGKAWGCCRDLGICSPLVCSH